MDEERSVVINLNVQGNGFLTGFRISNEEGNQVLGTYGESMFSVMGVNLQPGEHTVGIYFITDWEAVVEFYRAGNMLEYLVDERDHYSYDIFSDSSTDYSVSVSSVIR